MNMILHQVDSFTRVPFRGNPAGVCVLDAFPADTLMQDIAAEMNLAETAFVVSKKEGSRYDLRWFTPVAEVDLCGHATLASAHILFETGRSRPEESIIFETRSGELGVRLLEGGMLQMNFPSEPPSVIEAPAGLAEALGTDLKYVGANRMDVIVEVADEETVRSLTPNISALEEVEARGVIVTAPGSGETDFVSRFFAPRFGVPEDPVTGSAHCCLAPFWATRTGKTRMLGYQASRRGGFVRVELKEDRVLLGGYAVTVFRAEMSV